MERRCVKMRLVSLGRPRWVKHVEATTDGSARIAHMKIPLLNIVCRIAVVGLLLSSFMPFARAEWREIERFEDGMRIYADRAGVQREGDVAHLSHLVRWGSRRKSQGSRPICRRWCVCATTAPANGKNIFPHCLFPGRWAMVSRLPRMAMRLNGGIRCPAGRWKKSCGRSRAAYRRCLAFDLPELGVKVFLCSVVV